MTEARCEACTTITDPNAAHGISPYVGMNITAASGLTSLAPLLDPPSGFQYSTNNNVTHGIVVLRLRSRSWGQGLCGVTSTL